LVDINPLIDAARERGRFPSDRQLAKALGITRGTLSQMRRGECASYRMVTRLAELAGVDPEATVLDIVASRAKSADERAMWERIRHRLVQAVGGAAIAAMLTAGTSGAQAASGSGPVYIITNISYDFQPMPYYHSGL
jgi:transcriptional regulator with XRE-family HTH domain